jgi:hypothetical protein
MRYYVLERPELPWIEPFIIAEVVGFPDEDPGTWKARELAGHLVGCRTTVASREELQDFAGGAEALAAWDMGDDSGFDDDCRWGVLEGQFED